MNKIASENNFLPFFAYPTTDINIPRIKFKSIFLFSEPRRQETSGRKAGHPQIVVPSGEAVRSRSRGRKYDEFGGVHRAGRFAKGRSSACFGPRRGTPHQTKGLSTVSYFAFNNAFEIKWLPPPEISFAINVDNESNNIDLLFKLNSIDKYICIYIFNRK